MKILKVMIIATLLLLAPAYAFSSNLGYTRISLMDGDVQIKTPEAGDWGLASINAPLEEGDQVWVPQGGRAELQLNTGTYIRLDENSALQVLSMDKDSSQFYLSQGHAYIYYDAPSGSVIQVDTPDASTRAFNRAIFRIDMSDQYTDVGVYKGYVETENRVGNTRINAGEMLSVGQDTNGEVAPMGPPDEWEKWNKERNDRVLEKGAGYRYLPPELRTYSYDFDNYGKWVDVPEYGHCWTPTVSIGAGWAPYRDGRWIWSGGGYIWVDYKPWGWAPYHYGRWAFVGRVGWCWVPPAAGAVYWGPGYVGWVRTADYVAWVPLAPGEIYYGRGYYGPHSVNITNININRVNITNVYKNVYVNNGVTVVNRKTFATATPRIVNVNQNVIRQRIFVKNNISVGTPAIRPTKASYFMSAKRVPAAKLPPKPVRELRVKELKQARPFVKTPDKSVLNPGARPRQLPLKTITTPKTPGKGRPMLQPVQPAEKGKSGAPAGGPGLRSLRPQVKPEKKPAAPEGKPGLREERRIKPPEKRPIAPEGGPAPKEEKRIIRPEKKLAPESRPAPKEERRITPPEKRLVPEGGPVPKEERHMAPPEKRLVPEGRPAPREDRRIKPPEKKPVGPEGGPGPRVLRPQVKPEKKPEGPKKEEKKKTEEPAVK
jgi:hypothetical protein